MDVVKKKSPRTTIHYHVYVNYEKHIFLRNGAYVGNLESFHGICPECEKDSAPWKERVGWALYDVEETASSDSSSSKEDMSV